MTKFFIIVLFCTFIPYCTCSLGDVMIGPGRWLVINIQNCPDDEKYPIRFDLNRRKVNRTHDGFSGLLIFDVDFDDSFGIYVDICKHVDGGCKPYTILTDDSCCHFIEQYAKDNVERCFMESGIPLPVCPMPKGTYEISNFVFNYEELPAKGIYGIFGAKMYAMRDEEKISCIDMTVRFDSSEDDDD